jgi:L-asparaginase
VILTGSQLPIGDLRTDAKENLLTSLYYASLYENDEAVIKEVAVYFEYKLLRGNRSLKYSAEFFDAYQSPNYPILGQSGVHLNIEKDLLWKPKGEFELDIYLNENDFLQNFPGMNFESLLEFKTPEAIVLQVFGSGTIFNSDKTRCTSGIKKPWNRDCCDKSVYFRRN